MYKLTLCPVFPDAPKLRERLGGSDILNSSLAAPAAVLRLRKSRDFEPEVLYWDDGTSFITILTGAAVDPKRNKFIAGGVVERHFIVCDMSSVTF
jgi:arylesterase / paraoxonase